MIQSIVALKQPVGPGWTLQKQWKPPADLVALGYPVQAWLHASGLFVLSAVEVAHEPDGPDLGPEYHVSVSLRGARCSSADALWVLAQFDLTDAIEDNHVPSGRVRNFWRPVSDNLSGYECPCVEHEPVVREDKGDFVWRGITK